MSRTFPSFGLKNVIRLCALVLTMCVMANSERSMAQTAPVFLEGDTASFTLCYPPNDTAHLNYLLRVSAAPGEEMNWQRISSIGGATLSTTSPVTVTGTGADVRANIFYQLTYTPTANAVRYFTMRVYETTTGLADTIVVKVTILVPPVSNSITGDYDEVHFGQSISFSNSSAGGVWRLRPGTHGVIDSITGILTYSSGTPGFDSVIYHKENACFVSDSAVRVRFLSRDLPVVPRASPGIISIDTAFGLPANSFTLTGSNFNSTPTANVVYFGGTRATVTGGSTTSLTVTIPYGATFSRITVLDTVTRLTGYLRHNFLPTFSNCAFSTTADINPQPASSIALPGGVGAGVSGVKPYTVEMADIDGDGKLDMIATGTDVNTSRIGSIYVYRNISTPGSVGSASYATPVVLRLSATPTLLINLKAADLNGDGKPEIIAACPSAGRVDILRNTSTPGTISFANSFFVGSVGVSPSELSIADYNNDGRPDIGVTCVGTVAGEYGASATAAGKLAVIRNDYNRRAAGGAQMQASDFTVVHVFNYQAVVNRPLSLSSADFNGDGKLDIVVSDHNDRSFKVFKNTSASGISFDTTVRSVSTAVSTSPGTTGVTSRAGYPNQVRTGDFNLDGIQEIIIAVSDSDLRTNNLYNFVSVYSNTSYLTDSAIFRPSAHSDFATGVAPVGIAVGDLNGDHKQDVVVTNSGDGTVSIIKNTSSGGAISSATFAAPMSDTVNYLVSGLAATTGVNGGPVSVFIGDIDNNTIPDIAVVSREQNTISIVRNAPLPVTNPILTSSPDSVCLGSSITIHSGRLICTSASGTWSSANGNVTVTPSGTGMADTTATLTAVGVGFDTVYYKVVSLNDTAVVMKVFQVTDSVHPGTITGPSNVCVGNTINLNNPSATVGGTWTSSNTAIASISSLPTSTPSSVLGVDTGSVTITYTATKVGCPTRFATRNVNVSPVPLTGTITSPTYTLCSSDSTLFTITGGTGGTWTSSNPAVASITGVVGSIARVAAVSAGSSIISYTVTNSCGSASDTQIINVSASAAPSSGPIVGAYDEVYFGDSISFTNSSAGGTFSLSGGTTHGTVATRVIGGVTTGIVTSIWNSAPVTDTLHYIRTGVCGSSDSILIIKFLPAYLPLNPASGSSITSTDYEYGIPGSTFTISGSDFNTITSGNIVYFGGTRATVTSASATSLSVTIPFGATFNRITVIDTATRLMGFNRHNFTPTWNNCAFTTASFINPQPYDTIILPGGAAAANSGVKPYSVEMADLDNDGKLDMVVTGTDSVRIGNVYVYKNISTAGTVDHTSFAAGTAINVVPSARLINVKLADLDRDGLPEIITCSPTSSRVYIMRNISTPGTIAFDPSFYIDTVGVLPAEITTGDFNKDGRTDIGIVCVGTVAGEDGATSTLPGQFTIITNNYRRRTPGNPFINALDFKVNSVFTYPTVTSHPISIASGDLNGDGFLDVAISDHYARNFKIFRNTSAVRGAITFDASITPITTAAVTVPGSTGVTARSGYPNQIRMADFDADGIQEIVVAVSDSDLRPNNLYNYAAIYQNTSYPSIGFIFQDTLKTGVAPVGIAIGDMSGDHMQDIVITNSGEGSVSIIKNTTSGGAITFARHINHTIASIVPGISAYSGVNAGPVTVAMGDIDNNTIPDLVAVSREQNIISIVRNAPIPVTNPITTSTSRDTLCVGSTLVLTSPRPNCSTSNGIWVASNGHATVVAAGSGTTIADTNATLTAVSRGIDTIYYKVYSLNDTATVMKVIYIMDSANAGAITGPTLICLGTTDTLSNTTSSGGTWTSSNMSIDSVLTTSTTTSGYVYGAGVGTATISYTATAPGCPSSTITYSVTVVTSPTAGTISGATTVIAGTTATYSVTGPTGTWAVSNTSLATISTSGVLTAGSSAGVDTVWYIVSNSCGSDTARYPINIILCPAMTPITGTTTLCAPGTTTLSNVTAGGVWLSSTPAVATVDSVSGVVTGVGAGSAIITYINRACSTSDTALVNVSTATPPTISGSDSVCQGAQITLTGSPTGGSWSASNGNATVVGGVVTGVTAGLDTITYSILNACGSVPNIKVIRIDRLPNVDSITGSPDSICQGGTTTYISVGDAGGVWSSSSSIAAVGTTGIITGGTTSGTATISYIVSSTHGCRSDTATKPVFVRPAPNAGSISGASFVCKGASTTLNETVSGGVWSVTPSSSATIDPSTGTLTGLGGTPSGSSITITYVVTDLYCGTVSTTYSMNVRTKPNVPAISATSFTLCTGNSVTVTSAANTGPGGGVVWSSANPAIASVVGIGSGIPNATVTALTAGTVVITDSARNTCGDSVVRATITVNPSPNAGRITGPNSACVGTTPAFSIVGGTDSTGGNWTAVSANLVFNSVSGTPADTADFLVISVGSGRGIISYAVGSPSCGTSIAYDTFAVIATPNAGDDDTSLHTLCPNTQIVLNNSALASFTSTIWASADPSIAIVSPSGNTFDTVTGIAQGDVTIFNIDSNVCGSDTATYRVRVLAAIPNPGVITGVTDSVCKGSIIVYQNTTADTVAGPGVWSTSNSAIASVSGSTTTSTNVTGVAGGTAIISYKVTNVCGDSTATKQVTVNDFPQLTSSKTLSVCDSDLLTYLPIADSSNATFTWSRAATVGIANPAVTGTVPGISEYLDDTTNTNVSVIYNYAIGLHGCVTNDIVTVTVKPTPYLLSSKNVEVCSNSQLVYRDTESVAGTVATWGRKNPLTFAADNVTGTSTGTGTGSISEVLTTNILTPVFVKYGYNLNANGCSNTDTVTVKVNPIPAFPAIATRPASNNICAGSMYVNFGSNVNPVGTPVNYSWTASNAEVWATGNTRQYSLVNFTKPGTAYVYLLATIPGFVCASKDSVAMIVSETRTTTPEVIYFNGDFVCLSNVEESYQWGYDDHNTLDSTILVHETNQNYTNVTADINPKTMPYWWVITRKDGCERKSYLTVPVSVKNVTGNMGDVSIFPNPTTQYINLEISNTSGGSYTVEVMNMLGQQVSSHNVVGNKTTIDVADLAAGVYFIECYRDGVKFATEKFIKN